MTTAADFQSASDLCDAAAQAALQQQLALGPCPQGAKQAAVWTDQNSQLQHNINTLSNLSSSLSGLAVGTALEAVWPDLQGLAAATASAQAAIAGINKVSAALTTLAAVISFGVAVAALQANPTPDGVASVVNAFNAVKTSLATKS